MNWQFFALFIWLTFPLSSIVCYGGRSHSLKKGFVGPARSPALKVPKNGRRASDLWAYVRICEEKTFV